MRTATAQRSANVTGRTVRSAKAKRCEPYTLSGCLAPFDIPSSITACIDSEYCLLDSRAARCVKHRVLLHGESGNHRSFPGRSREEAGEKRGGTEAINLS